MLPVKALLILSVTTLPQQSRRMLAISPINPPISKIRKPYHAMHLQQLLLHLYATTNSRRPSNLPNGENLLMKLVFSSQSPSGHTVASHPHMQSTKYKRLLTPCEGTSAVLTVMRNVKDYLRANFIQHTSTIFVHLSSHFPIG